MASLINDLVNREYENDPSASDFLFESDGKMRLIRTTSIDNAWDQACDWADENDLSEPTLISVDGESE